MPAAQVQISLPIQGVLRDVRHAFLGLCIDAGQRVLAAMMEADRIDAVRAQGRARRRSTRRARRHHRQPGRAGRPAHRCSPTTSTIEVRGRTGAAQLRLGGMRRPAGRGHDGGHRRGRVDPALCQHPGAGAGGPQTPRRLQERGVAPLRAVEPGAARAVARAPHWRARSAGGDDRRHPLPRPRDPAGAGHRRPGQQACPGAARGLHRGHPCGRLAAVGPDRARARRRSHAAVGHRRRQGAAQGHRADLRRPCDRAALPGAQAPQRPGTSARGRCTPASSGP